ncbi:MAG: DNA polymerase III subunit delta' [Burkholderiaceae bacterium]|nr:DNA polymerase III subunit delta' [Burkholderiaceae bacterium]
MLSHNKAAALPANQSVLPWLVAPLAETLRTQRGHALLAYGPDGVGQFEFATALARAWLCEAPAVRRPEGLACGNCESCHLVDGDQVHPDLCVLLPEAKHMTFGWRQKTDAIEQTDSKKKPSQWISIDQMRAAIEFSALTRSRGRMKVVVVHPAERMPQAAASALLKLLEEPPANQRLVLGCGDVSALLPTVRSRCQTIRLPLPDSEVAVAWLRAAGLVDAPSLLAASGGQPLSALERQALGLDAALCAQLPQLVAAGNATPLAKLSVPLVVELLQKLCHDALLVACGVAPRYFKMSSVVPTSNIRQLTEWGRELRRVSRNAEHPWNAGLMLESLLQQGQRALTQSHVGR